MDEKRILPPLTEEEYKKVADLLNGAILMAHIHGAWNEEKNGPLMEKHFPGWEKLEPAPPNNWKEQLDEALETLRETHEVLKDSENLRTTQRIMLEEMEKKETKKQ
jgi:hypothetical protein